MALEYLQIAEAVAREKDISKEDVLIAMEQAIQSAARKKNGLHFDIHAEIDRVEGNVVLKKLLKVVEKVQTPISDEEVRNALREGRDFVMEDDLDEKDKPVAENDIQITLKAAKKINPNAELGDIIPEDLPAVDFGRIAAQTAKQVIFQKVREAERAKEFTEYENSEGEIINGIVKRTDYNGVTIDLGRAEAYLPREEMIQKERYNTNDRVRAYIYKVESQQRGAQIFVSRTHPEFLKKLFAEEVAEIENGIIEIMGVARDAGFRAKIAVKSYDQNLDPVGACVGIRGSRVQAITEELQGERVDIIEWTEDPAQYLIKALAPAEVSKVVLDEDEGRIEVVVDEENLSIAIGRRGQNVRLASMLTGWDIDIMTAQEESDRREKEFNSIAEKFISALDIDENLTHVLVDEGFSAIEDLLLVDTSEFASIEGIGEEVGVELQRRAQAFKDAQAEEMKALNISDDLRNLEGLSSEVLVAVAKKDIKTLDDFAELATDELLEIVGEGNLRGYVAEELIMKARQHWFDEEEAEAAKASGSSELAKSDEDLKSLEGLSTKLFDSLTAKGVMTRDDLADLATDELMELVPDAALKEKQAEDLIMEARKHWFAND